MFTPHLQEKQSSFRKCFEIPNIKRFRFVFLLVALYKVLVYKCETYANIAVFKLWLFLNHNILHVLLKSSSHVKLRTIWEKRHLRRNFVGRFWVLHQILKYWVASRCVLIFHTSNCHSLHIIYSRRDHCCVCLCDVSVTVSVAPTPDPWAVRRWPWSCSARPSVWMNDFKWEKSRNVSVCTGSTRAMS